MISTENNLISKGVDKKIIIATTFREFNGNSNDQIQRLFLKSLREQTYQNYILVATTFGEKNVEKALTEENIPHKVFEGSVSPEFRFSATQVLENGISLVGAPNSYILMWTTCDVVLEPSFLNSIKTKLPHLGSGTSYPHVIYPDTKSYEIQKNKVLFWAGIDTIFFDADLLTSNEAKSDIKNYPNLGWGFFEFFLTGMGLKYARKMINIWPIKLEKIDNDRAINNETSVYLNTTSNHNKSFLEKFISDNKIKKDFFRWLAYYKYPRSQLVMRFISIIKLLHVEHKIKMSIKNILPKKLWLKK